jgi:EAL domain-containing protein (putative c-di-GMP-specific phosphodiesterase class I)
MVRSEDLVCRIGGDQFVIAMASPSHSSLAQSMAQRVVEAFTAAFTLSVGDVIVTPSIGIAQTPGAAEARELIRDADIAMYQAKGAGRNTFALFDISLRDKARARMAIEQALRGALGRGELSVAYQPIVGLATDELAGFEALMRWDHPELGRISPLDFIPIAEETGLIVDSGAWLLQEAVDQMAVWHRDRGPDLPQLHISVNISTRQLRDSTLVDVVRRALARTGLPATALWLEITESVLADDPDTALSVLNELRDLGITLCIDDFGTGYASLSYVRRLPARIVKVDKCFIDGIGDDAGDEAIIRSVIAMARALHQQVVAEGVETIVQRDWLQSQGCDMVQGWLYGAPRPAGTQVAWMDRNAHPLKKIHAAPA